MTTTIGKTLLLLASILVSATAASGQQENANVAIAFHGSVVDHCGGHGLPATLLVISTLTGDTLALAVTELPAGSFSTTIRASRGLVVGSRLSLRVIVTTPGFPIVVRDSMVDLAMQPQLPLRIDFPLGVSPAIISMVESDRRSEQQRHWEYWEPSDLWKPFLPAFENAPIGLTIQEIVTTEQVPLLGFVFFDSGSTEIPTRYHRFTHPVEPAAFDEQGLPTDGVLAHSWILDIIGSRLRRYPATSVEIQGSHSMQPVIGEDKSVADRRATTVRLYLTDVWGIDSARVRQRPSMVYMHRRSVRDPLWTVEERNVQIFSDDWEIVRPAVVTRARRHPFPARAILRVENGIDDNLVAERRLELRQGGKLWRALHEIGRSEREIHLDSWTRGGEGVWGKDSLLPLDTEPLEAVLTITRPDGSECISQPFTIPVTLIDSSDRRRRDSTMIVSSMIQFKYDSPEPGPHNERVIRELIPLITPGSRIDVSGYNDITGMEDRNRKLTEQRARAVADRIRKLVKAGMPVVVTDTGWGETVALYANELPEGRFLNRSVRVTIIRGN